MKHTRGSEEPIRVWHWVGQVMTSPASPSSRYESVRLPPSFLMTWMASRLPEPFSLMTAFTASLAKWSLWWVSSLEDSVVRAMFSRSSWKRAESLLWRQDVQGVMELSFNQTLFNQTDECQRAVLPHPHLYIRMCYSVSCQSHLWSTAASLRASRATCVAFLHPEMMVCGWIFLAIRSSASCKERAFVTNEQWAGPDRTLKNHFTLSSSAASTVTEVVPSPTSSSWTFDMSDKYKNVLFRKLPSFTQLFTAASQKNQRLSISLTNQNFGGRVVDANGFQDGRSIVGHRHCAAFPSAEQDLILSDKREENTIFNHPCFVFNSG